MRKLKTLNYTGGCNDEAHNAQGGCAYSCSAFSVPIPGLAVVYHIPLPNRHHNHAGLLRNTEQDNLLAEDAV